MKCNQSRPGFELESLCPFPTTITITPRAPLSIFIVINLYTVTWNCQETKTYETRTRTFHFYQCNALYRYTFVTKRSLFALFNGWSLKLFCSFSYLKKMLVFFYLLSGLSFSRADCLYDSEKPNYRHICCVPFPTGDLSELCEKYSGCLCQWTKHSKIDHRWNRQRTLQGKEGRGSTFLKLKEKES